MSDQIPTRWACTACGNTNVLQDAYVTLNTNAQGNKEIVSTFDYLYCPLCDGESSVEEIVEL